jgi:hypothetical protein
LGAKCHFKHINPLQTDKRFSHSHSSSSSSNTSTTFIPHRVCSYFVEGRCARGKACTFLHPTEKSASVCANFFFFFYFDFGFCWFLWFVLCGVHRRRLIPARSIYLHPCKRNSNKCPSKIEP